MNKSSHSHKPSYRKPKKQPRSWLGIMALSLGLLLGGSIIIKQDEEAFVKWLAGLFDEQTIIDNAILEHNPPKEYFPIFELHEFEKTGSLFRKQMGLTDIRPPNEGFTLYAADSYAMDKVLLSQNVDSINTNSVSNLPYLPKTSYLYWIGKIRIPKTGVYNIHTTNAISTQSRIFLDGYSISFLDTSTLVYLKKGTYVLEKELEGLSYILDKNPKKELEYTPYAKEIWVNIEPMVGSTKEYETQSKDVLSYQIKKLELAKNTVAYYGHVAVSNQENHEIQVQLPNEEREHIVFLNHNPPIDWIRHPKHNKLILKPLIWVLNKGSGREPKAIIWQHQNAKLNKNGVETHSIPLRWLPFPTTRSQWHHTELCPKNQSDTYPCQPLENQKAVEDFYLLNDGTIAVNKDGTDVPFVGISLFSDNPTDVLTLNQGINLAKGIHLPIPNKRPTPTYADSLPSTATMVEAENQADYAEMIRLIKEEEIRHMQASEVK